MLRPTVTRDGLAFDRGSSSRVSSAAGPGSSISWCCSSGSRRPDVSGLGSFERLLVGGVWSDSTDMTLFRLDASIRVDGSHSRALGDLVEHEWTLAHPGDRVLRRHLGTDPVPATAWADADSGASFPSTSARSPDAALAAAWRAALDARSPSPSTFGVSQHFKTYVDVVVTDPRMAAGRPLPSPASPPSWRPSAVAPTAPAPPRGLGPRHAVDASHPGGRVGSGPAGGRGGVRAGRGEPALDQFADLADVARADAAALATEHGRSLAAALRRAA